MSQQNKIGKHRHGHAGIVAVDDGVCVKLPRSPGGHQFQLVLVVQHNALRLVAPDSLHKGFQSGVPLRVFRVFHIPDIDIRRSRNDGQSGEVALYANALNLLYPPLEIPRAVSVPQNRTPLRVVLAALGAEQQSFFHRDSEQFKRRRRLLGHADKIVVIVIFPLVQRFLRPNGEFLPANQTVRKFAPRARVTGTPATALIDNFVKRPAVSKKGQNFGNGVNPRILHIVHTASHKFGGFFVFRGIAARFDVPIRLFDQHFDGEQDSADNIIILGHFPERLDAPAPAQFPEKLLIENSAPSFLTDTPYFLIRCHSALSSSNLSVARFPRPLAARNTAACPSGILCPALKRPLCLCSVPWGT